MRGVRSTPSGSLELEHAFSHIQRELAGGHRAAGAVDFRVIVEGEQRPCTPYSVMRSIELAEKRLINVFRHAHAKMIEMELAYAPKRLTVSVRDDGRGINPDVLQTGWTLGAVGHAGTRLADKSPTPGNEQRHGGYGSAAHSTGAYRVQG